MINFARLPVITKTPGLSRAIQDTHIVFFCQLQSRLCLRQWVYSLDTNNYLCYLCTIVLHSALLIEVLLGSVFHTWHSPTLSQGNGIAPVGTCLLHNIDGFVQDCRISSALAMEIMQYCTKPSILYHVEFLPWWQHCFYRSFIFQVIDPLQCYLNPIKVITPLSHRMCSYNDWDEITIKRG